MSTSSTNPSTLFGGTWEQIKDRFLLCEGTTYKAGTTGGEATHRLTIDEMPSHNHTVSRGTNGSSYFELTGKEPQGNAPYNIVTSSTGGNKAHNNMPPYLAVYVWKRTK